MKWLLLAGMTLAMGAAGQEIRLAQVASGISNPTDIESARDGSGRLFLVQQNGLVKILRGSAVDPQPFLDITSKTRADGERGLLGLAFPPDFAAKQRFYVDYTDLSGNTTIAMYRVGSNPDLADASSETVLLKIAQPYSNHNGGQVRFGPDGYLYIGMGDGGSAGDPQRNAQNRLSLLGKLLRLDVESQPGTVNIPPDNPFIVLSSARGEIWALGLRNPWRFSFDRATGDLWIADVGQDAYEEVDFQPASSRGGENYGWNQTEGLHCYTAGCNLQAFTAPVAEYPHSLGCSVTGGFVYRGRASPGLRGIYLYGDYCSGRIWGIERQSGQWASRLLLASGFNISTFGEDEAGELYVANAGNGTIHRIEGSQAPRYTGASVVNAAGFAPGVSPGSLATVFAAGVKDDPGIALASSIPIATTLEGVSVTVNGVAAPIHGIASVNGVEQVNFQVPFEVAGSTSAAVVVARGEAGPAVTVAVVEIQPAVYGDGAGNAVAVHNADYTLVTPARPLVPGEYAFVYAAGLGRVQNPPPTGAGAPVSPPSATLKQVRVTVGGVEAPVPFAGLAPGLVGVFQVDFQVPAGAPSGLQDVRLIVDGAASPALKVPVQ